MADSRLGGKTAIVTGAASGIGESIAQAFAENGANVVVADIDARRADVVATKLTDAGHRVLSIEMNVAETGQVQRALAETRTHFGNPQILANNAGIEMAGTVASLTEEQWDRVMAVNLRGTFLCCKYVLPLMLAEGNGAIVNISSDLGIEPIPNVAAYAASKAGIIAITKAIAKDFGRRGIRANCIAPGPIDTPLLHRFQPKEVLRLVTDVLIPQGRLGRPEEVAGVALFLASEEASFVNGAVVTVNGGLLG